MDTTNTVIDRISERDFLSSMQLAEAMGDMTSLAAMFHAYRKLSRSTDPGVQSEYARLRSVLEAGQQIEQQHGRGSLFRLDHPSVSLFTAKGVISPSELANAAHHQASLSGQNLLCA
ncbi:MULTISPECIES: hypothetical protein [unclassified Mesorhizobium]|uniref:hypothetical protein n=1 Tax=unclassified Mesorhizobium TaxID=325217 RepID=UPI001093B0DD|nr:MULTISPECIES: hypothetical protein [unclassified Mesorhizobium]TGQ73002.1 hypothetical protein EN848_06705 [bacterium M00.F.Ca.ET.205.01.1.1]TGU53758.1 hypothetical protein EN795_11125 [bacterium M00.F.Ca.ET.152.01.1.1]TGV37256.1 hypothetical protein EN829_011150 [Mesorhizobium sp. M00.F.Ca.ET.186.01.1.1]TGZ39373.1 hypothetical protein EN805_28865 [bacterium M00.F.Ca.ET.162.01.1.1]TGT92169.1 hypothetical protein EN804_03740 [Mesorhizobium sp. M8A.F.Ca.ET.161.01.1.1]